MDHTASSGLFAISTLPASDRQEHVDPARAEAAAGRVGREKGRGDGGVQRIGAPTGRYREW
ncbi:MAG: hypothetical protein OZSIB_0180 [Candidatus Ozemobacter sibiricus]|uniref:Uncharacterized protein n=1 Tax=Candidatus Ozemobacter sibiricus TaxID=2268124 RepID=A0A367ZNI1_9BACT|nr:MAG: hypothetical protein OZSIB_0180 [Candidatus Ozemobacter sibiricus]